VPPLTHDQILTVVKTRSCLSWGVLPDERTGLSCNTSQSLSVLAIHTQVHLHFEIFLNICFKFIPHSLFLLILCTSWLNILFVPPIKHTASQIRRSAVNDAHEKSRCFSQNQTNPINTLWAQCRVIERQSKGTKNYKSTEEVTQPRPTTTKAYPKVSGLSRYRNKQQQQQQQQTLVQKQHKGIWWQNSLDWLTK